LLETSRVNDEPQAKIRSEPYHVRILEDRWTTVRHVVEAVAILAAGLWAFYIFVYQEKIKPAGQPAALNTAITIRTLGHNTRRDILGLRISLHNSGQTEIDIAADGYDIWGERYATTVSQRTQRKRDQVVGDRDLRMESRTFVHGFMELRDMAIGGHVGNHIVLEPGDNETFEDVVAVPHGLYDLFYARVIAVPIKTSQKAKLPIDVVQHSDGSYWLNVHGNTDEDDNDTYYAIDP
jgi:hypothetical protein